MINHKNTDGGFADSVKITLDSGKHITITSHHLVHRYARDLNSFERVPAKEIQEGDFMMTIEDSASKKAKVSKVELE